MKKRQKKLSQNYFETASLTTFYFKYYFENISSKHCSNSSPYKLTATITPFGSIKNTRGTEETPKVKIATKADMSDAKEVEGVQTQAVAIEGVQYYSNKASVSDLKENTTYYYQVFQDGKYQDAQKYSTKSFKNYSFLYVGDPQIGASSRQVSTEGDKMKDNNYAARNDGYNWNNALQ